AGLPYREVAAFLGIGLSAAKKRAHVARGRLKELLPMAADLLSGSRPSRDGRFRDTVLLFAAIRRRDRGAVGDLLAGDPGLPAPTRSGRTRTAGSPRTGRGPPGPPPAGPERSGSPPACAPSTSSRPCAGAPRSAGRPRTAWASS